jgi:Tfp pilus assembly protein PilF
MAECSRCGEALEPGSRFCGNCGLEVEAPGPDTTPPAGAFAGDPVGRQSYLKTGWRLFKKYPGGFIGFTALTLVIQMGLGALPKVGWLVVFINYPLMFGLAVVSAGLLQGRAGRFGDFFQGFRWFATLLLLGLVSQAMIILGLVALVVPGVYLMVGYALAPWFVLDRRVGFWEAMEMSRKQVQPHWFEFGGLVLKIILLNLLGALALGVGLLVTIPVSWCALSAAFGARVGFAAGPQPATGEAAPGAAGRRDWAPAVILTVFLVALGAAGLYVWTLAPWAGPSKAVTGPTKTVTPGSASLKARIYLEIGNMASNDQQRLTLYSKAIEIDPNYATAYNNRASVHYDRNEYGLALHDYNKAIALRPDYVMALNNRGMIYLIRNDYTRALQDFNKAIESQPDYVYAYNNRGIVYFRENHDDQAIIEFSKAIKIDPHYYYSYNNRGNAYYRQKKYGAAIIDYTHAIRIKPDFSFAYGNRGYAYFAQGDDKRALADYDKALALDPEYAMGYYRRALLYKKTGAYGKARADYDRAAALQPRWLDAAFPLPEGK